MIYACQKTTLGTEFYYSLLGALNGFSRWNIQWIRRAAFDVGNSQCVCSLFSVIFLFVFFFFLDSDESFGFGFGGFVLLNGGRWVQPWWKMIPGSGLKITHTTASCFESIAIHVVRSTLHSVDCRVYILGTLYSTLSTPRLLEPRHAIKIDSRKAKMSKAFSKQMN